MLLLDARRIIGSGDLGLFEVELHQACLRQQDLDLVSPGLASRVVGVVAKGCSVMLADPADPEGSLIYQKLSPTPPCGAPMPLARPPLSRAEVACVLAWIAAQ